MASNRAGLLGCSLLSLLSVSGCADFDMSKAMPLIRIESNLPLGGNNTVSSGNSAGFQSSQAESWSDGSVVASDRAVLKVIPVGKIVRFYQGNITVLNAEIVGGDFVKLNILFEANTNGSNWYTDIFIANPVSNSFLLDDLGRQYSVVQSKGISPDDPVRVKSGGIWNFSVIFPIKNNIKKFSYNISIYSKYFDIGGNPIDGFMNLKSDDYIRL